MPPKKDDKKKKGGASALKEIDPSIYVRKQTPLGEVKDVPREPNPNFTGYVANIENLFPEWSIEGEVWSDPVPEGQPEVVYPKNLHVTGSTNFTTLFGLEPVEVAVDPKAKPAKKEAPKKGAKEPEPEVGEQFVNADGKQLPVMFNCSENEFLDSIFPRDFTRNYNMEQEQARAAQAALQTQIDELTAAGGEDSAAEVAHLSEQLQAMKADLEKQVPSGVEVDPYVVAAYRTVLRFAPNIIAAGGECGAEVDASLLWRAVYPKLPSGKPYYNAAGKYAVRLFLAGKWRKVYVTDVMPTREDGSVALASSSNRYELWPMVLAKALYTVFSVCGYAGRLADVQEGLTPTMNYDQLDTSHPVTTIPSFKIAQFVAFAVHLLLGWQPASPVTVSNTFIHEKSKSARLLESIFLGGVHPIEKDDIIHDDDVLKDKRLFHSCADDHTIVAALRLGGDILDNGGKPILKTKKVFQQEYADRKKKRDGVVAAILRREERIAKISALLASTPMNEFYTVSLFDHDSHQARVFPILGMMFPENATDLLEVRLLVDWRTAPPVTIPEHVVSVGGVYNPTALRGAEGVAMRRDDEAPLPQTTPLIYEWITVSQLVAAHSYVIPIATNIHTPHMASFSRHWQPLVAAAPAAAPEKGKEKAPAKGKDKGAAAAPVVPAEEQLCGDQGMAPVTFLTVDTTEFFARLDAAAAKAAAEEEAAAALEEQQIELERIANEAHSHADHEAQAELAENHENHETHESHESHEHTDHAEGHHDEHADHHEEQHGDHHPDEHQDKHPDDHYHQEAAAHQHQHHHHAHRHHHHHAHKKKDEMLPIQVLIHADIVTKPHSEPSEEQVIAAAAAAVPPAAGGERPTNSFSALAAAFSRPQSSHGGRHDLATITNALMSKKPLPARKLLPSDIVLILEEVRTDDQQPLMYIMDLKDTCFIPVLRRTFSVPASRLTRGQPLVFWIRLFTKASLFLNFSSLGKVEVDEADKIWSGLGREVFVAEGDAGVTRENTEQLLFRLPLLTTAVPPEPAAPPAVEPGDDLILDLEPETPRPERLKCKTFFYINDREIERHVTLKMLDCLANPANTFSRLHQCLGNILPLHEDPQQCNTLIGTCYPTPRGKNHQNDPELTVHPFHWKVLVIADAGVPIVTPAKPVGEEAVTQRYNGKYYANNRLSLFRDVFSIEKSSFPISARLLLSELPKPEGSSIASPMSPNRDGHSLVEHRDEDAMSVMTGENGEERLPVEDMYVVLRMYRKSDKKLVSEWRGKKLCLAYTQALEPFLPEGEEAGAAPAAAAASAAKGAKDAKAAAPAKGGKGGAPVAADTVDVIVECELDVDMDEMVLLPHLRSRFPLVFDPLFDAPSAEVESLAGPTVAAQTTCLTVKPASAAQFQWQLDVLAGKVASVSHDLAAVEKYTAAKNAWETASAGRTERAQAAMTYFQERRNAENAYNLAMAAQMDHMETLTTDIPEAKALVELTPAMLEALVTALDGEQAVIAERYKRVRALPLFSEEIQYLEEIEEPNEDRMLRAPENLDITQDNVIHASAAERRAAEREASHKKFADISAAFVAYNTRLREETKERVGGMAEAAVADLVELSKLWAAREAYRLEAEARNAALTAVLGRAKQAVAKAVESEIVVDDPKKKGKKK